MTDEGRRRTGLRRAFRSLVRKVGPASRILAQDIHLTRDWMRHRGAIADALGPAEADAYTRLVEEAAARSLDTGRTVARQLPDQLALVSPDQRARYLSLLRAVLRDRHEALGLVIQTLPQLLSELDDESLSLYLSQAIELHQDSIQKASSFLRMESHESREEASRLQTGAVLRDVRKMLTLYARAHCGEDVQVRASSGAAFTDGRHIYLPSRVDRFGDERDLLIYRVLTARNAGFIEFGSLAVHLDVLDGEFPSARPGELEIERFYRSFLNPVIARDLFLVLEGARVEACVRHEYPGVARDMDRLSHEWRPERDLRPPNTAVERVLDALIRTVEMGEEPPSDLVQEEAEVLSEALEQVGQIHLPTSDVHTTLRAVQYLTQRLEKLMRRVNDDDLERLDENLGETSNDTQNRNLARNIDQSLQSDPGAGQEDEDSSLMSYQSPMGDGWSGDLRTEVMESDERAVEGRARDLLEAMRTAGEELTLSEARERARRDESSYDEMAAFLERTQGPAGPAVDASSETEDFDRRSRQSPLGLHAENTGRRFLYPEWDLDIDDYKPDWAQVTEYALQPGGTEFVEQVNDEYGPLIGQIRKAFEALRPEGLIRHRGLLDGDDIDIDRAVQERIERRAGGVSSGRIYMRRERLERDVAVAFLVDMSSSTNEVVNEHTKRVMDVAKEALVLIAEAVDAIGDACAIWGFSGYGRDQVAFYVAKEFEEAFDDTIRERVGRISWKMENRDGAAIRHATTRLQAHRARIKLLILLSDGKPLDCGCDRYQDRYAQEDTRMALLEARKVGIHPFCITVDPRGAQYLGHMYGPESFTVIDRVDSLPLRLPQVYRRLTR